MDQQSDDKPVIRLPKPEDISKENRRSLDERLADAGITHHEWDEHWAAVREVHERVASAVGARPEEIGPEEVDLWRNCPKWVDGESKENCAHSILYTDPIALPGHVCEEALWASVWHYIQRHRLSPARVISDGGWSFPWLCEAPLTVGACVERSDGKGTVTLFALMRPATQFKEPQPPQSFVAVPADPEEGVEVWEFHDHILNVESRSGTHPLTQSLKSWYYDRLLPKSLSGRKPKYDPEDVQRAHDRAIAKLRDHNREDSPDAELAEYIAAELGGTFTRSNLYDWRQRGVVPTRD